MLLLITFALIRSSLVSPTDNQVKRGCLNKLTSEQIEQCAASSDECKKCVGNKCNSRPEFLSCVKCDSDNDASCLAPSNDQRPIQVCQSYEDKCFIHAHASRVIRGCLSEMIEENLMELIGDCGTSEQCEICNDQSLCNSKAVTAEICVACLIENEDGSIQEAANCLAKSSKQIERECPLSVRPLGCFHFEDEDVNGRVVKRDCMTRLLPDERAYCREETDLCKTCNGNNCNSKPTFQSCFECQSINSDDCERAPNRTKSELCKNYNDECFIRVTPDDAGTVVRGCLSKTQSCGNEFECMTCSIETLCNGKPIEDEFCISCDSRENPDCRHKASFAMQKKCPMFARQVGCYHHEEESHTRRGCIAALLADDMEICRNNSGDCRSCTGNGCNSKKTLQRCVTCSSETDKKCIENVDEIASQACEKYDDECFTSVLDGHYVERGCLSQVNDDFIDKCKQNPKKCVICSGGDDDACNDQAIGKERCVQCDSTNDTLCASTNEAELEQMSIECNRGNSLIVQGCYLNVVSETNHQRGCVSDIVDMEKKKWCVDNNANCKVCEGDNCNRQPSYQQCYECQNCAEPDQSRVATCNRYVEPCVIYINETGYTVRGCSSTFDWEDLIDKDQVTACEKSNCNGFPFPVDRLRCYQCNGEEHCQYDNHTDFSSSLKICEVLESGNKCYSYLGNGNFD